MKNLWKRSVLLLLYVVFAISTNADILHVPGQFPDVQSAIDAASNGDTVLVDPGVYYGGFVIDNKTITLCSQFIYNNDKTYINNTVLDGGNTERVLEVSSNSDTNYITGLTIQNGYVFSDSPGSIMGGGICASGNIIVSHSRVLNNIIKHDIDQDNAGVMGGGMYSDGYCIVKGCLFASNEANALSNVIGSSSGFSSAKGGGLCAAKALVQKSVFEYNILYSWAQHDDPMSGKLSKSASANAGGGGLYIASEGMVVSNIISSNEAVADYKYQWTDDGIFEQKSGSSSATGGGIFGHCSKINNLISDNFVSADGYEEPGSVDCTVMGSGVCGSGPVISCTIIFNQYYVNEMGDKYGLGVHGGSVENSILWGNGDGFNEVYNVTSVIYTCIDDNDYPGTGNIYDNPQFLGTGDFPYSLSLNSPCIDAGNPATPPSNLPETDLAGNPRFTDGDGNGSVVIDMGAYEFFNAALLVNFSATPTQTEPSKQIQFTSEVTAINTEPELYQWDFQNDGIIDSYEQDPVFAYSEPGEYDVKLMVTDTSGSVSVYLIKNQYITISLFEAAFTMDKKIANAPIYVHFYDTSEILYTQVASWKWDFNNDGVVDSQVQNPSWTYQEPGLYSVTLMIFDVTGLFSDTLTKLNCVTATEFYPGFLADQKYGKIPLTVHFEDTSMSSFTQIDSWQWDLDGDNIIDSEEQNPVWLYENTGVYTVSLIITDTSGLLTDTAKYLNYIDACRLKATFNAYPVSGEAPLTVNFTDLSQVEFTKIGTWEWDFNNDGTIDSELQDPLFTYNGAGIWSVALTITDTSGLLTDYVLLEDMIEVTTNVAIDEYPGNDKFEICPNPFSETLTISLNYDCNDAVVILFDISGNPVRELRPERSGRGRFQCAWDGRNSEGVKVGKGLYMAKIMDADKVLATRKILYTR
ncbi:MAG: PKD domain-containing protein [Bacteroidales bacterium]|nr:PKD domain-containing protein [Bacteroidales bacterium]